MPHLPAWLYNTIAVASALLLVGLEMRSPTFRALSFGDRARARRNWAFLAASIAVSVGLGKVSAWFDTVLPRVAVWGDLVVLNLLGCFLAAELFGYAAHWVKHKNEYLWRFHFQHHNEEHMSIWMATHTHGLEAFASGATLAAMLTVLGFSAFSVQVYLLFYAFAKTYQHSAFSYTLGWLDRLVVSPAYHSYHHAVGSQANYGNTLTVWDVVFRTARFPATATKRATRIGLDRKAEPFGFVAEMVWFLGIEPKRSGATTAASTTSATTAATPRVAAASAVRAQPALATARAHRRTSSEERLGLAA